MNDRNGTAAHISKTCNAPSEDSTASFWHSQPSPLLTGHRSTRNLPSTADIVIIGSGITGASVAHHLLNPSCDQTRQEYGGGPRVVMLEAREACWGATGRNGGHCQPLLLEHPDQPSIGTFELNNYWTLQQLIKDKQIDCEYVAQLGVRAIYSQSLANMAELALHTVQSNAPESARLVKIVTNPKELAKLRVPTAKAAIVTDVAARLWPYKFVSRILEDLIISNVLQGSFNLQTLTPVQDIRKTEAGKWNVRTQRGDVVTSRIILATNAYTSQLLPTFADIIVPCRGQMSALYPLPSVEGKNRLKDSYSFASEGIDDYLIQRPNEKGGHLMFGGGRHLGHSMGVADDSVIDDKITRYLRTHLVETLDLPEGKNCSKDEVSFRASHIWTGIMGYSRDDVPWVGPVPGLSGLFMSAGYTGHGMPNAWLCGETVALMIQGSGSEEANVRDARKKTGMPQCYLASEDRLRTARELESVERRDWMEHERGRINRTGGRPPSGYA